ncbi:aspartate/glutamate racemase family protein [Bacillus massiliigorillae]|uniref:aspartate/glutamate racemase family protein n=1 Tax=Bacillus massiliigorillae TaxID=1243664 RepID=UPI0003A7A945|nr:aspartate/glutamate racemase family protein [Bacillus massiliigorillae]
MKVGCVHATTTALKPIEKAFHKEAPDVELLHFMDTGLLEMLEQSGSLTADITRRFSLLINLASQSNVDAIQLTCSAFNTLTDILQPLYNVKLFRSDEAMLDSALAYKRIGLVSTVRETPIALSHYLKGKNPDIIIDSQVDAGIIHLLFQGQQAEHDEKVRKMIHDLDGKVDVIVLSQYSMEHVADQVKTTVPLLTAPGASAKKCIEYIRST